ncbi:hypothetical protein AJ88_34525 [Mesorhizobium amorphae CCBAU 01583]|nr:hypothetical protein AJ88_34525 [Mesorhizobium amorphae CCBAU 01583]
MTGEKRLFLDVRQSATGVSWEHRLTEWQDMTALAIAQGYGVPDIVARVLAGRGVTADRPSASSIRRSAISCRIRHR